MSEESNGAPPKKRSREEAKAEAVAEIGLSWFRSMPLEFKAVFDRRQSQIFRAACRWQNSRRNGPSLTRMEWPARGSNISRCESRAPGSKKCL